MDLGELSTKQLLRIHSGIGGELRSRGLVRTGNNLCADLAETLVSRAFNWRLNGNSKAGHDTLDGDQRIEIKACRIISPNGPRQTSAIRRLQTRPFDRLLGVVFDRDYDVILGVDVPFEVVCRLSGHSDHTKSAIFHLRDTLLERPGVINVTAILAAAATALFADR